MCRTHVLLKVVVRGMHCSFANKCFMYRHIICALVAGSMPVSNVFKTGIQIKQLAPAVALVSSSLVWFTLASVAFGSSVDHLTWSFTVKLTVYGVYYAAFAVSALLGASLFPRSRGTWLISWMVFGVIMTALLPLLNGNSLVLDLFVSLLFGVSVGAGLPSSLAYFADTTVAENRGMSGGVIWGVVGFGVLGLALLTNGLDQLQTFLVLAIWRAAGLAVFFVLSRFWGNVQPSANSSSYRFILRRRDVTLYLLPWIMFCLVNFAESPILGKLFGEFQTFAGFIEFAISGVFAIVGGILADIVGRKRVVITGFVILGIEYAVLSLFSASKASWYVYTTLDGIAWGMFASVFFMTLWGDLAEDSRKEKYYVLGGLAYPLAYFLPVIVKPFAEGIETATAFSLASFFLFLAVLPLMYAPETLPEKKIKEMELKSYAEKAKKMKEKTLRTKMFVGRGEASVLSRDSDDEL